MGGGEGVVINTTPRPLYPQERHGTYFTGGWVGLRASLDGCGKSCSSPGFDSPYVQPIASRYADYAIPVHPLVIKGEVYFLTEFVNFEHLFSKSPFNCCV